MAILDPPLDHPHPFSKDPSVPKSKTPAIDPIPAEAAAVAAAPAHTFAEFDLKPGIMRGVEEAGFITPSPIQHQTIPLILQGRDLIGQAHTGTGKTAAFGLPGMNRITHAGYVEMLVITPTRELATQVGEELARLGRYENIRTVAIYGGQPYGRQLDALRAGVEVVVATPGRLLDLLEGGRVRDFVKPSIVVLDEADEMLDMGFLDDIKKIFAFLPAERQTLLFSATMPAPIRQLAATVLNNPAHINSNPAEMTVREIQQHYFVIGERERDDAIIRLLDSLEPPKAIIFSRTRSEVDRLAMLLQGQGCAARGLHGDMEQRQREEVIGSFRAGQATILVATDVAARGLDIADVTHVINYHIPFDPESYVHRIGRTGRAGRKGMAVTLITPHEYQGLKRIQGRVGKIQLGFLPSRRDIRASVIARLGQSVREQPTNREADKLAQTLAGEIEPVELVSRMLTMLLDREMISGPEHIGLDMEAVARLQRPEPPRFSKSGPPRGPGASRFQPPRAGRFSSSAASAPAAKGPKVPWGKPATPGAKPAAKPDGKPKFTRKKQ